MKVGFVRDDEVAEHFGDDVAADAPAGLWVPRLYCDHCSEVVENGQDAVLRFRTDPGAQRGLPRAVHEACAGALRRERPGDWLEESLNLLPVQLANALHPDPLVVYDLTRRPWSPEPELLGLPASGDSPQESAT